jgi:hypothetical protein
VDIYRKPDIKKPAAWLHTMYMEGGQIKWECKCDEHHCPYCSKRHREYTFMLIKLLRRIQVDGYDPLWKIADDVEEAIGSAQQRVSEDK